MFSLADEIFQITQYKYILTYKFSQDHLEMFFSKIRQRFGNNNNPNALELKTAMKQILLKNSITSSYAANCIALDNTGTESVFEIRWAKKKVESLEEEEEIPDLFPSMNNTFDIVKDNILYYISGFIVRCLLKKVDCQTCANSMLETLSEHNYNHKYSHSILVNVKNRGGLIKSSINVIKIVRVIENTLIQLTLGLSTLNIPGLGNKIILAVKNYVYSSNIFTDLNCDNDGFLENHRLNLVTLISKQYLKIRLHHLSNLKTICNVSKRRLLTKLIIFNHQ